MTPDGSFRDFHNIYQEKQIKDFTRCYGVSIVNIEQVNVHWITPSLLYAVKSKRKYKQ